MFISFSHDLIANVHIDWVHLNTMSTQKTFLISFVLKFDLRLVLFHISAFSEDPNGESEYTISCFIIILTQQYNCNIIVKVITL